MGLSANSNVSLLKKAGLEALITQIQSKRTIVTNSHLTNAHCQPILDELAAIPRQCMSITALEDLRVRVNHVLDGKGSIGCSLPGKVFDNNDDDNARLLVLSEELRVYLSSQAIQKLCDQHTISEQDFNDQVLAALEEVHYGSGEGNERRCELIDKQLRKPTHVVRLLAKGVTLDQLIAARLPQEQDEQAIQAVIDSLQQYLDTIVFSSNSNGSAQFSLFTKAIKAIDPKIKAPLVEYVKERLIVLLARGVSEQYIIDSASISLHDIVTLLAENSDQPQALADVEAVLLSGIDTLATSGSLTVGESSYNNAADAFVLLQRAKSRLPDTNITNINKHICQQGLLLLQQGVLPQKLTDQDLYTSEAIKNDIIKKLDAIMTADDGYPSEQRLKDFEQIVTVIGLLSDATGKATLIAYIAKYSLTLLAKNIPLQLLTTDALRLKNESESEAVERIVGKLKAVVDNVGSKSVSDTNANAYDHFQQLLQVIALQDSKLHKVVDYIADNTIELLAAGVVKPSLLLSYSNYLYQSQRDAACDKMLKYLITRFDAIIGDSFAGDKQQAFDKLVLAVENLARQEDKIKFIEHIRFFAFKALIRGLDFEALATPRFLYETITDAKRSLLEQLKRACQDADTEQLKNIINPARFGDNLDHEMLKALRCYIRSDLISTLCCDEHVNFDNLAAIFYPKKGDSDQDQPNHDQSVAEALLAMAKQLIIDIVENRSSTSIEIVFRCLESQTLNGAFDKESAVLEDFQQYIDHHLADLYAKGITIAQLTKLQELLRQMRYDDTRSQATSFTVISSLSGDHRLDDEGVEDTGSLLGDNDRPASSLSVASDIGLVLDSQPEEDSGAEIVTLPPDDDTALPTIIAIIDGIAEGKLQASAFGRFIGESDFEQLSSDAKEQVEAAVEAQKQQLWQRGVELSNYAEYKEIAYSEPQNEVDSVSNQYQAVMHWMDQVVNGKVNGAELKQRFDKHDEHYLGNMTFEEEHRGAQRDDMFIFLHRHFSAFITRGIAWQQMREFFASLRFSFLPVAGLRDELDRLSRSIDKKQHFNCIITAIAALSKEEQRVIRQYIVANLPALLSLLDYQTIQAAMPSLLPREKDSAARPLAVLNALISLDMVGLIEPQAGALFKKVYKQSNDAQKLAIANWLKAHHEDLLVRGVDIADVITAYGDPTNQLAQNYVDRLFTTVKERQQLIMSKEANGDYYCHDNMHQFTKMCAMMRATADYDKQRQFQQWADHYVVQLLQRGVKPYQLQQISRDFNEPYLGEKVIAAYERGVINQEVKKSLLFSLAQPSVGNPEALCAGRMLQLFKQLPSEEQRYLWAQLQSKFPQTFDDKGNYLPQQQQYNGDIVKMYFLEHLDALAKLLKQRPSLVAVKDKWEAFDLRTSQKMAAIAAVIEKFDDDQRQLNTLSQQKSKHHYNLLLTLSHKYEDIDHQLQTFIDSVMQLHDRHPLLNEQLAQFARQLNTNYLHENFLKQLLADAPSLTPPSWLDKPKRKQISQVLFTLLAQQRGKFNNDQLFKHWHQENWQAVIEQLVQKAFTLTLQQKDELRQYFMTLFAKATQTVLALEKREDALALADLQQCILHLSWQLEQRLELAYEQAGVDVTVKSQEDIITCFEKGCQDKIIAFKEALTKEITSYNDNDKAAILLSQFDIVKDSDGTCNNGIAAKELAVSRNAFSVGDSDKKVATKQWSEKPRQYYDAYVLAKVESYFDANYSSEQKQTLKMKAGIKDSQSLDAHIIVDTSKEKFCMHVATVPGDGIKGDSHFEQMVADDINETAKRMLLQWCYATPDYKHATFYIKGNFQHDKGQKNNESERLRCQRKKQLAQCLYKYCLSEGIAVDISGAIGLSSSQLSSLTKGGFFSYKQPLVAPPITSSLIPGAA